MLKFYERGKERVEKLEKRSEEVRKLVNKYRGELEETMKRRPMESAGIIFIAGLVLGLLIGASSRRR
ncbi:MAG: hypothetical protein NWF08_03865 [Candidatus Bathyarchaeota archaeon]|nr:hypothetical protein [Candidatus Bathyarchaeota archaeon]